VFLESATPEKQVVSYNSNDIIFAQGDPSDTVMYLKTGSVRLSVLSPAGKEAIVAMLAAGDFIGESVLAGRTLRSETARAATPCTLLVLPKPEMIRMLHAQPAFSDRFMSNMLERNARLEADLVDQIFNPSEKRLARALLLLAGHDKARAPLRVVPGVSQEALAEMIGTTRSRVNFFLNRFRKRGFITYDRSGLIIDPSLLTLVNDDLDAR
jgi:CRP/FNR family transcriptional regulator, cyclic AMP receptor protein